MKSLTILLCMLAFPLFAAAQTKDTSKLTGTIYDALGSVTVGAKLTAVSSTGKTYETVSNQEGVYVLTLPFNNYQSSTRGYKEARYDITVRSPGFKTSVTKGYVFIPSHLGKMYLDIALEIAPLADTGHP